jgi:predicted XRE-type DNA-binding protein
MKDDAIVTRGSGNIFADLGVPDAEEHLLKAQLVLALTKLVEDQGLSQTAAAARMGIAQPDLSKILRGRFSGFSLERLLNMVRALGNDVEISVRPVRAAREGRLKLKVA